MAAQGGGQWQKHQQGNKSGIEGGDWGVFVSCDLGKEGKCMAEVVDVFSQVSSMKDRALCIEGDPRYLAD